MLTNFENSSLGEPLNLACRRPCHADVMRVRRVHGKLGSSQVFRRPLSAAPAPSPASVKIPSTAGKAGDERKGWHGRVTAKVQ